MSYRDEADCRHLVSRQRAGLIRADDCCAAERFHRRQFPHDHVPLCHAPCTQAKACAYAKRTAGGRKSEGSGRASVGGCWVNGSAAK